MSEYQVRTDVYNGPMDLLLYLIRRDEVDIYDIPVARITKQYVEYVEMLRVIDPNVAGDFLVMAAQLMELKSRMLLPRPVAEVAETDDITDPRLELVRQLLEYKKYKDASFELNSAAERQAARWPRVPVRIKPPPPDEVDIDDVQIWDLVAAFNKIMSSIGVRAATHDVVFDDTPISLHALDIVDRLQNHNGVLAFEEVFKGRTKSEMIGLFLALLELMRQQRVRITQSEAFAPIQVTLLSAEPIEIGDEYEPGLRSAVGDESKQVHDEPGEGDARTTSQSGAVGGWPHEDEDEAESFAELDGIKTDVDMDSILREGRGRDEEPEAGA